MKKATVTGKLSGLISKKRQDQVLIALILILVISSYLPVLFYSRNAIAEWFTTDDAFYYFKVAENIAAGKGVTFDGIARTNGFHPLWLMLITPLFLFSSLSKYIPLRLIILLQMVLAAGSGYYFYLLSRRLVAKHTALLASLAWVLLPSLQPIFTNGTEAGLNSFLLTLFWYRLILLRENIHQRDDQTQDYLSLGLIGAFLVFARLDNIFLLIIVGLWLFFPPLLRKTKHTMDFGWKDQLRNLFVFFVPVGAFFLVYFSVNVLYFDTLMPVSGQVKKWWGTLSHPAYGSPVKGIRNFVGELLSPERNVGPWWILTEKILSLSNSIPAYYRWGTQIIPLGLFITLGMVFMLGYLAAERKKLIKDASVKFVLLPLFFGAMVHISYYKIFGYLAPRAWYWIIEYFIVILGGALVLEMIVRTIHSFPSLIRNSLLILIIGFGLVGLVGPQVGRYNQEKFFAQKPEHYYLQKAKWLERHTESEAIVGMTGAGSTAYFVEDRIIINLDGLINGKEYFSALKSGTAFQYFRDLGGEYIFANPYLMKEKDPYQANFGKYLINEKAQFNDRLTLWKVGK
jgi:hypothetical protein